LGYWTGDILLGSLAGCRVKWAWTEESFYPSSRADATLRNRITICVNAKSGEGPDEAQRAAMECLLNNEATVTAAALDAAKAELYRYLPNLESPSLPPDESSARDRLLERVAHGEGIREIVSLAALQIYKRQVAGCAYTGFIFNKGWDYEHDLLVIMHKDRVVGCGDHGDLCNFEEDEDYENEGEPVFGLP
jgi:hypothetical protein